RPHAGSLVLYSVVGGVLGAFGLREEGRLPGRKGRSGTAWTRWTGGIARAERKGHSFRRGRVSPSLHTRVRGERAHSQYLRDQARRHLRVRGAESSNLPAAARGDGNQGRGCLRARIVALPEIVLDRPARRRIARQSPAAHSFIAFQQRSLRLARLVAVMIVAVVGTSALRDQLVAADDGNGRLQIVAAHVCGNC